MKKIGGFATILWSNVGLM